ncbi:MAG: hypothetical protein WC749_12355 [Dehalococcoidia bacterium]
MIEIELVPDLSSCIQTVAKREYDKVLRGLLQKEGEDQLFEEKLEILKWFLESADFARLRSEYEKHLFAGNAVRFKVRSIDGQLEYEVEIG